MSRCGKESSGFWQDESGWRRRCEGIEKIGIATAKGFSRNIHYDSSCLSSDGLGEIANILVIFFLTSDDLSESYHYIRKFGVDFVGFIHMNFDVFLDVTVVFVEEEPFVEFGVIDGLSNELFDVGSSLGNFYETFVVKFVGLRSLARGIFRGHGRGECCWRGCSG